jgi:hypothetical protein
MSYRLSTGMRNKLNDGGATGGYKGALNLGFIAIMTGSQPATGDAAATGTLLGTVSVNGGGTGLTFDASVAGVLSKAAAETWRFTGLADGVAGWFRFYASGDTITNVSTTAARLDGAIGTSGAELNLTNLQITTGQVNTCDTFTITQPAQ